MPRVILLRHGQTEHNNQGIMQGWLDVPLNEEGKRQAQAAAKWIRKQTRLDRVYASDLLRARQTAEPIAELQSCPIHAVKQLREMNVGEWQGLTWPQSQLRDPDIWEDLRTDPLHTCRPGGECLADVCGRTVDWWQQTIEPLTDLTCCVVTHGIPVRAILAHVLNIDPVDFGLRISLPNTGISIMEYKRDQQRWQISCINATCHLG